ncbi:Rpr2-domain-containing protein [Ascodesmis nigricans]|uniref:Rpr2-domain-containing protein n=1 Tax=Ascodesmis nigricans TaxID=341454 RepID=A0A4S2N1L9_9PEZI|nr:Rpr2-domain-containing protein [Ascodesmis nigricans]
MAKTTSTSRNPNHHLHSRLSHLYQASTILTAPTDSTPAHPALARFYLNHFRSITKKSVTRLDPSVKRTICKRCDSLLVEGVSSTHRIENASKGGRKAWADVLVVECNACGAVKRFPVGIDIIKEKRGKKFVLWSEAQSEGAVQANVKGGAQKSGKQNGKQKPVFRAEVPKLPAQRDGMGKNDSVGTEINSGESKNTVK